MADRSVAGPTRRKLIEAVLMAWPGSDSHRRHLAAEAVDAVRAVLKEDEDERVERAVRAVYVKTPQGSQPDNYTRGMVHIQCPDYPEVCREWPGRCRADRGQAPSFRRIESEAELERLRRVEQAARDVVECRRPFRLSLDALGAALDPKEAL